MKKVKVTDLPLYNSLKGLFALGVDKDNRSVQVSLQFLEDTTSTAVANAESATAQANDATAKTLEAKEGADKATADALQATKDTKLATEETIKSTTACISQTALSKTATDNAETATTEANKAKEACNTATINAKEATNKCTDKLNELEDITDLVHEAPKDGKQYARQDGEWSEVDGDIDISQLSNKASFNSVLCNNTPVYTFDGVIKDKTIILKCNGQLPLSKSFAYNSVSIWRFCKINNVELYRYSNYSNSTDFIVLSFDSEGNVRAYANMEFLKETPKDDFQDGSDVNIVLNGYVSFFCVLNACVYAPDIDNVMARFFSNGRSNLCEYNPTMLSKNPIADTGSIINGRFWVSPKKHSDFLNKSCYTHSKVKITNKSSNALTAEFRTSISDSINYKQTIQPGETVNMEAWGDYNYNFMLISPYNQTDLVDIDYDIQEVVFECLIDPRFASIDSCNEMISGEKISNASGSFISNEQQYLTNINYRNEYAGQMAYVDGNVYIGTNTIPYTKANWKKITQ